MAHLGKVVPTFEDVPKLLVTYYYDFELRCHFGAQEVHFPPPNNNNNINNNWDHYLT